MVRKALHELVPSESLSPSSPTTPAILRLCALSVLSASRAPCFDRPILPMPDSSSSTELGSNATSAGRLHQLHYWRSLSHSPSRSSNDCHSLYKPKSYLFPLNLLPWPEIIPRRARTSSVLLSLAWAHSWLSKMVLNKQIPGPCKGLRWGSVFWDENTRLELMPHNIRSQRALIWRIFWILVSTTLEHREKTNNITFLFLRQPFLSLAFPESFSWKMPI